jgi:acyl-coenzyme A thioesterase PaaI-like protein
MKLAALPPITRELFRVTGQTNSFGAAFLGLRFAETGGSCTVDHFDSSSISVTVPWPAWLLRADGQLCLAGALAIADETSTFGMAAWDKQIRAGVSVSLSGQRCTSSSSSSSSSSSFSSPKPIEAGERITFASRLIKGGANLAWIHLEARREQCGGELLAVGRHLKFQPSGQPPGWALASHPLVRPALYQAVELANRAGYSPMGERLSKDRPIPLPAAGTSRTEALSMVEDFDNDDAAPSLEGLEESLLGPDAAAGRKAFTAHLTRQHGNPGASLHGGCASLILDAAASASFCDAAATASNVSAFASGAAAAAAAPPAVQRMHVNLLGAVGVPKTSKSKKSTVAVRAAVSSTSELPTTTKGHAALYAPGSAAKKAVEAEMWW